MQDSAVRKTPTLEAASSQVTQNPMNPPQAGPAPRERGLYSRAAAGVSRFAPYAALAIGAACVAASALTLSGMSREVTPQLFREFASPVAILAVLIFALACRPVLTAATVCAVWIAYAFAYSLFSLTALTLGYAALMGIASWLLAAYAIRPWSDSPLKAEFRAARTAIAMLAFIATVFGHTFSLLALQALHSTSLLLWAAGWTTLWALIERETILTDLASFRSWLKTVSLDSSLDSFLGAALTLVVLFSGLIYLVPDALCGDSDKAYLAIAKFYANANSLFLRDAALVRDGMRSFPHFEEVYFAAGYILNGALGAKLLAWLLVCVKLYVFYFVAVSAAGLSRSAAKLVVLSFCLTPIFLELHAIERPENLLAITALLLFWTCESAKRARLRGNADAALHYLALGVVCACVAVSVKYTAGFFFVALAVVYWDLVLFALRNLPRLVVRHGALLIGSLVIAAFWYARNIVQWKEIVSYAPFDRYHLTVHFPPLRSAHDILAFIQSGLLDTSTYTEYGSFGYGFWGVILIGGLVAALSRPGVTRRAALVTLLFSILLLNSTRQIRYLGAVLPIGYMAIFLFVLTSRVRTQFATGSRWKEAWAGVFLLVQAATALAVNAPDSVGRSFKNKLAFADRDLSKFGGLAGQINEVVKPHEIMLTSAYDANFNLEGILMRGDPIWSFGQLQKIVNEVRPPYFLLAAPGAKIYDFPFFNDLAFFESVAEPKLYAGNLYLLKADQRKFDRVANYVERQGWPLPKTVIVSEALKQKYPMQLVLAEELKIPGLPHRLFRLAGMWWQGGDYRDYGATETFVPGAQLTHYFEDLWLESGKNGGQLETYRLDSDVQAIAKKKALVTAAAPQHIGKVNYESSIPEKFLGAPVVVELYARLAGGPGAIAVSTFGARAVLPAIQSIDNWYSLGERTLSGPDNALVRTKFELLDDTAQLRDYRVVVRRPHQKLSKLYVPVDYVESGAKLDLSAPVLSLSEDFISGLKTSAGLSFETERLNVAVDRLVDRDGAMLAADAAEPAAKIYRINFPKELDGNVIAKVFLSGAAKAKDAVIELKMRSIHGPGGSVEKKIVAAPIFDAKFSDWNEQGQPRLIAEQYLALLRTRPKGAFDLEVEVSLKGSPPAKPGVYGPSEAAPSISDFVIVVGQADAGEVAARAELIQAPMDQPAAKRSSGDESKLKGAKQRKRR